MSLMVAFLAFPDAKNTHSTFLLSLGLDSAPSCLNASVVATIELTGISAMIPELRPGDLRATEGLSLVEKLDLGEARYQ
jgi:hypothetical protein